MAANRQTDRHTYTHVRNAVVLVWGSLRLAPTSCPKSSTSTLLKIGCSSNTPQFAAHFWGVATVLEQIRSVGKGVKGDN